MCSPTRFQPGRWSLSDSAPRDGACSRLQPAHGGRTTSPDDACKPEAAPSSSAVSHRAEPDHAGSVLCRLLIGHPDVVDIEILGQAEILEGITSYSLGERCPAAGNSTSMWRTHPRPRLPPGAHRRETGQPGTAAEWRARWRPSRRPRRTQPVSPAAAAQPEQAFGIQQVHDDGQVDDQGEDLQRGHALGQLVDLVRHEHHGRHEGQVFSPAAAEPQPDRLDALQGRVRGDGDPEQIQVPELDGDRRCRSCTMPLTAARHRAAQAALQVVEDAGEVRVQRGLVAGEQEHGGCERGQDQEMQDPVDGDEPQDVAVTQRAAAQREGDFLTRRRVTPGGPAGGLSTTQESQRRQRYQRSPPDSRAKRWSPRRSSAASVPSSSWPCRPQPMSS